MLREAGVDAVNLVDGARAQSRMGVVPAALLVEREVGLETVFHYTCRDRNMLGMLSDLLGAAAGGLRNVLIVTGDPPTAGPYPDATAVFDIDSIGLTNVVRRLNHGLDPGGTSIGEPTRFVIGVAVNQGAVDQELELERFRWKVEAGAEFAVTQPVFDPGGAGRVPPADRPLADSRDRRDLAAHLTTERGVPGERGAGRQGAGGRAGADAAAPKPAVRMRRTPKGSGSHWR